jgi:hypothetical protein
LVNVPSLVKCFNSRSQSKNYLAHFAFKLHSAVFLNISSELKFHADIGLSLP